MTKKIKKLEKETTMYRSRWESSNKALLEMAEEVRRLWVSWARAEGRWEVVFAPSALFPSLHVVAGAFCDGAGAMGNQRRGAESVSAAPGLCGGKGRRKP